MKADYNMGADANPIKIIVTVGTVGEASTIVSLLSSPGKSKVITSSDSGSANIPETDLGTAVTIRNNKLIIKTIIDLSLVDPPTVWAQEKNNLVITYELSNGSDPVKKYTPDEDDIDVSPNGSLINVSKLIELI